MLLILGNHHYGTDSATKVGECDNASVYEDDRVSFALYREPCGEYFLHIWDEYYGIDLVMPLGCDEARAWTEEHLGMDACLREFGPPCEGEGTSPSHREPEGTTRSGTIERRISELVA